MLKSTIILCVVLFAATNATLVLSPLFDKFYSKEKQLQRSKMMYSESSTLLIISSNEYLRSILSLNPVDPSICFHISRLLNDTQVSNIHTCYNYIKKQNEVDPIKITGCVAEQKQLGVDYMNGMVNIKNKTLIAFDQYEADLMSMKDGCLYKPINYENCLKLIESSEMPSFKKAFGDLYKQYMNIERLEATVLFNVASCVARSDSNNDEWFNACVQSKSNPDVHSVNAVN